MICWALTNYKNKIAGDTVAGVTVKDSKNKYQSPNVLLSELNYYKEDITLGDNLKGYTKYLTSTNNNAHIREILLKIEYNKQEDEDIELLTDSIKSLEGHD